MTQWIFDLASVQPCTVEDEHSVTGIYEFASETPVYGICDLCGVLVPVIEGTAESST